MNPVVLLYQIGCKGLLLKLIDGEDETQLRLKNNRAIYCLFAVSLNISMFTSFLLPI